MPPTQSPPHLERRYYVQNWRADVVAITKSNGDPLQYVVYSPYGEPVTHAVADVDLDGDVDSNDQTAWANGSPHSTFAYAALEDLNHDGTDTAADDALFDESYTDNLGLSRRGRLTAAKLSNRKGHASYEHDESLTMYHVRNRVYRADLGRWMTRDPLGYVDGMGLYEYVRGMAVRGSDLSGLAMAVPCAGAGRCGVAAPTLPENPLTPPIGPLPWDDWYVELFISQQTDGLSCNAYCGGRLSGSARTRGQSKCNLRFIDMGQDCDRFLIGLPVGGVNCLAAFPNDFKQCLDCCNDSLAEGET